MQGIICHHKFGWAFCRPNDGSDIVFVPYSNCHEDDAGRRFVCTGETIEFDCVPYKLNKKHRTACNIRLLSQRAPLSREDFVEQGFVTKVGLPRGEWVFIQRPFGSFAFLHWTDVADRADGERVNFFVEQWWQYEVSPPVTADGNSAMWQAGNAVRIEPPTPNTHLSMRQSQSSTLGTSRMCKQEDYLCSSNWNMELAMV